MTNMRLTMAAVVFLVLGCRAPDPAPEIIVRDVPGAGAPERRDGGRPAYDETDYDAGSMLFDGGVCCEVTFAVPAAPDDQVASWVGPGGRHVSLSHVGALWSGSVCVALEPIAYYFEVGVLPDDGDTDAGYFMSSRVNAAVPTAPGNGVVDQYNQFDPGGAMACAALDGGQYSQMPDAGPFGSDGGNDAGSTDGGSSDGGSDAGALPTATVITGACDTLTSSSTVFSGATLDEEISSVTALPFNLSYFGTPVTHYAVSVNGFVQLFTSSAGPATQQFDNVSIPNNAEPNGIVAPFWDDLVGADAMSKIHSQLFGTGTARHLTVEWSGLTFLLGTGTERVTFQAKLFETSNAIEFHYCTLAANGGSFETGFGATTGIESLDGALGVQVTDNSATLSTSNGAHFE